MDSEQTIEMPWGTVTMFPNGNVVAENQTAIIAVTNEGNSRVTLKKPVRKVSVVNIMEVRCYLIEVIGKTTSHKIDFLDGGHVHLAYNDQWELIEFNAIKAMINLSIDGDLSIAAHTSMTKDLTTPTSADTP